MRLWADQSLLARILLLAILVAVSVVQYYAGPDYGFSLLYLIPISAGSYLFGLRFGMLISVAATVTWLGVETQRLADMRGSPVPLVNLFLRVAVFLAAAGVLARLRESVEREKNLAMTDFLTGIPNRRAFFQLAGRELDRARRHQTSLSLAVLDVDDFKQVNDRRGHEAGDLLLRSTGEILSQHVRSTDIVARVGGDEFTVLMPEADGGVAAQVMERVLHVLREELRSGDDPVTFTVGLVTAPCSPSRVDELLRAADALLYQGKEQGKDVIEQRVLC